MTPRTQETCSICLDTIDNLFVTNCGHYFHKRCIDRWLNTNDNCPLCRTITTSVEEVSNYTYTEEIYNNNNDTIIVNNIIHNINNIYNVNNVNNVNHFYPIHDADALCDYLNDLLFNMTINNDVSSDTLNEVIAVNDIFERLISN